MQCVVVVSYSQKKLSGSRPLSKVGMHVILGKAVGTIPRTRLDPWSASTCCSPSQGSPSCPQGSLL